MFPSTTEKKERTSIDLENFEFLSNYIEETQKKQELKHVSSIANKRMKRNAIDQLELKKKSRAKCGPIYVQASLISTHAELIVE